MNPNPEPTGRITLMAAGELRDALTALQCGDTAAAAYGLMSIDPASWQAIEQRLAALAGTLPDLLATTRAGAA
ncbi:hypothetical protein G3I60_36430 [Streptomyces sp. SID13666]|uniref:hypothetical protein n=1 Tax=Streptomyces sp. SID13666 TaxID=2706054 RepID=UPI0013C18118|nr:hypothetical protein [Streptomyces sp. SID13666]NEA59505.1 hypothetical protein [Streptomyces sp. SID13666]